jgi:hypothetical protein
MFGVRACHVVPLHTAVFHSSVDDVYQPPMGKGKRMIRLFLLVMMAGLLAACGGNGGGDDSAAASVVETYLTAKVAGDRDGVRDNLCAAMEADLDREALSFSGVQAEINDMACTVNEGGATVTCSGQIEALYGADTRFFELGTYNVVRDDGVWKWCGETAG